MASRADGIGRDNGGDPVLAPVSRGARIDVLDVLRGLAILGILYLNIHEMGVPLSATFGDGWSPIDFGVFAFFHVAIDGTQRGLLELLFGAGAMLLTARAMTPDGPVAVADLFYRRNLWLLGFGLFDIFALLWIGDVLHIYALAALFLFPFRKLRARWLIAIGLLYAAHGTIGGWTMYAERAALAQRAAVAAQHRQLGRAQTVPDRAAADEWRRVVSAYAPGERQQAMLARELAARAGGVGTYVRFHWTIWQDWALSGAALIDNVGEAFSTMLIGMALWKLGVIQGLRQRRLYVAMMAIGYGFGFCARIIDLPTVIARDPAPQWLWVLDDLARLAVTMGHVAAINLAMKTITGRRLLSPFRAVGRSAFSVYLLQSALAMWLLFAPWGPGLWGRHGWARMTVIATVVNAVLILAANLWLRRFAFGPCEWLWRSLSYGRRQPFLRRSDDVGRCASTLSRLS